MTEAPMMATNKVAIQVRIEEELYCKLRDVSERESRPINSQIIYYIRKGIEDYEYFHSDKLLKGNYGEEK
jgi:hypothetical protein